MEVFKIKRELLLNGSATAFDTSLPFQLALYGKRLVVFHLNALFERHLFSVEVGVRIHDVVVIALRGRLRNFADAFIFRRFGEVEHQRQLNLTLSRLLRIEMPVRFDIGGELQLRHGIVDLNRLICPFYRGNGLRESKKRQTCQQAGCHQDANIFHIRAFLFKKNKAAKV